MKYVDWKEQMQGLLGSQEVNEARKVAFVKGALVREAKHKVAVLEAGEDKG